MCERAGSDEAMGLRATSLPTLVQMVANGNDVTLLPRLAARVLVTGPDLVERPFRGQAPGRELGLVWRKNSPRAVSLRMLGSVIAAAAKKRLD